MSVYFVILLRLIFNHTHLMIAKEKFDKAIDSVLDNIMLAYGNIENHAGLLERAIQFFESMLVQLM